MRPTTIPIILTVLAVIAGTTVVANDGDERRRDVAERGSRVMPFDLDATTHRFVKQPGGGTQTVVADRPEDRRQISLIRQHLREEARAFSQGDFDDPAAIHGSSMPGLRTLRNAGEKLSIAVEDLDDGARLVFRTGDRAVVDALHDWFDAQVSDHGGHAQES